MDINQLFCNTRTGQSTAKGKDQRSDYQRDFDRVIFSSAFRRLQNKTQVFPLPGADIFVHNRLTHSLEVASVGRSLGSIVGDKIAQSYKGMTPETGELFKHSLDDVVATACLCHDIGNPAFGHSGEEAIASYFKKNEEELKPYFTPAQWNDLINFEGNANAIRVLSGKQVGKSIGGMGLTYTTLASIAKYPCESLGKQKGIINRKKFGFFQSEKETFLAIAKATRMIQESSSPIAFKRHPFVWLVEAADDICYNIIDLEDSHRLKIIDYTLCKELLLKVIEDLSPKSITKVHNQLAILEDKNEQISYLRAKCISTLVKLISDLYLKNFNKILDGTLDKSLFNFIEEKSEGIREINKFSIEYIYNYKSVLEIEHAGYNVMHSLLSLFVSAILKNKEDRSNIEEKTVRLIPNQYIEDTKDPYLKVLGVLDFISGMTDNYATNLYRKIKGIELG